MVVGALLGGLYMWSPLAVWFVGATCALLHWALRDLRARERKWTAAVLSLAIALRLLGLAGLVLWAGATRSPLASFFGDEFYLKRRALWLLNSWLGVPLGPLYFTVYSSDYGWTGYHYVLAWIQLVVGASPFGMHLCSIVFFVAGAVLLYRLARRAFGRVPALGGLILLCFWPTLFVWSIAVLKESFQLLLTALVLTGTVQALRTRDVRWRAAAVAACIAALFGLSTLRAGALAGSAAGVAGGIGLAAVLSQWTLATTVLLAILSFSGYLAGHPERLERVVAWVQSAAMVHIGQANTPGHAYKLLDERLYIEGVYRLSTMTLDECARYVVRGLLAFLLVPLPWHLAPGAEVALLPEQLLWYIMEGLAVIGVIAGLRRNLLVTSLLVATITVSAGVIAMHDGNVGTLLRHRDGITPLIVWLSALGATSVITAIMKRQGDVVHWHERKRDAHG